MGTEPKEGQRRAEVTLHLTPLLLFWQLGHTPRLRRTLSARSCRPEDRALRTKMSLHGHPRPRHHRNIERPLVPAGLPPPELASSQTQEWAWQASGQASWVRECPRGAVTGAPCRVVCWVRSSQINVCGVTARGFGGSECHGKILRHYAGRHCHHKESTNRKGPAIAQDSFQTYEHSRSCFLIHNALP